MLALLFPGQGSQRPGMGAPWRDHPAWAVAEAVASATGRDVAGLLLDADADTIQQTRNAQLAAFTLSAIVLDAARAAGLDTTQVAATAGHSLGEYSALLAAGALDLETGARLVAARGDAMQHAADTNPGTMAAVLGLEWSEVQAACAAVVDAWPANDNAPGQVVVAGTAAGVEAAGDACKATGAKRVLALRVGGAFHSPLMAPAQPLLDAALAEAAFRDPVVPVVTNADAREARDGFADSLSRQLVSPVRWRQSLQALAALGVTRTLELGPGTELSGMVKRTLEGVDRAAVATPDDLGAVLG
ncbi:MAG TPA: ACP S-malonyltransferase [Acidimicrobiales bacterium]|nr:ACP S-malonyltransferase [Acidimicrobiales bacterium]